MTPTEKEKRNGDGVGDVEEDDRGRQNGVQGARGANVDDSEQDHEGGCEEDSVVGHTGARVELCEEARERQAAVWSIARAQPQRSQKDETGRNGPRAKA